MTLETQRAKMGAVPLFHALFVNKQNRPLSCPTDMKKASINDAQVGHVAAHSIPRTKRGHNHFLERATIESLKALVFDAS